MEQSTNTKSDLAKKPIAISSDAFYFEKDKSRSILVLGVGNYLMGDEGVGVHLIQHMDNMELPDHLDILPITTLKCATASDVSAPNTVWYQLVKVAQFEF